MRMMSTGPVRTGLYMLAAALVSACAAGTAADPVNDTSGAVAGASVFVVQNNQATSGDIIVYLEPDGRGQRHTLGTVAAGATGTFNHTADRGYYTLIAADNRGQSESSRFNIPGPSTVTWIRSTNRVTVRGR